MSFINAWKAISARIDGISQAAQLYGQFRAVNTADSYGVSKQIGQDCFDVLQELELFADNYESVLPAPALEGLRNFLSGRQATIVREALKGEEPARSSIIFLVSLRSQLNYLLTDRQEQIRSRTERAFLHLQRLLAVDLSVQVAWKKAFEEKGETACERLGAVHLLWHGIFAFKINAAGARTDLVFADTVEDAVDARGLEGFVLTEWKTAEAGNATARFAEAREQAQLYRQAPLAGLELARYRYVVAVSLEQLPKSVDLGDVIDGNVVYRHINLAIRQRTPSLRAREG